MTEEREADMALETATIDRVVPGEQQPEFEHNEHTFLWGQDCASKEKGGVFNVTKGLQQKFGAGRVLQEFTNDLVELAAVDQVTAAQIPDEPFASAQFSCYHS